MTAGLSDSVAQGGDMDIQVAGALPQKFPEAESPLPEGKRDSFGRGKEGSLKAVESQRETARVAQGEPAAHAENYRIALCGSELGLTLSRSGCQRIYREASSTASSATLLRPTI